MLPPVGHIPRVRDKTHRNTKCLSQTTVVCPRISISASLPAGRRPRLPEITTTWLEDEGVFQRTDDILGQPGRRESRKI
ncbi:hypothetical protein HQ587_06300 [bacterium]|nr:hypothetical protein [bacterium]